MRVEVKRIALSPPGKRAEIRREFLVARLAGLIRLLFGLAGAAVRCLIRFFVGVVAVVVMHGAITMTDNPATFHNPNSPLYHVDYSNTSAAEPLSSKRSGEELFQKPSDSVRDMMIDPNKMKSVSTPKTCHHERTSEKQSGRSCITGLSRTPLVLPAVALSAWFALLIGAAAGLKALFPSAATMPAFRSWVVSRNQSRNVCIFNMITVVTGVSSYQQLY